MMTETDEEILPVLNDATLTAKIIDNVQPDDKVFFYKNTGPKPESWYLTYKKVQTVLAAKDVSVSAKSEKSSNLGVFSINGYYNWVYSHNLFPTPGALKEKIYELLRFVGVDIITETMGNFFNFKDMIAPLIDEQFITYQSQDDIFQYNWDAQIFNRKFQFRPLAIIYCQTESDVKVAFTCAKKNNLPFRVRSGGHDHEGECSANNVILIDMTQLKIGDTDEMVVFEKEGGKIVRARISPGRRFIDLTTELADKEVMIPHGTCATVGIAGFTMGGGWGPWTRQKGMCCERLVRARILLGDGEIREVSIDSADKNDRDLLWALKGGGGFSYGIVTELVLETFPLPPQIVKFEVHWNSFTPQTSNSDCLTLEHGCEIPTTKVLQYWENVIGNVGSKPNNANLVGTNLKISGKNLQEGATFCPDTVTHNCIMYGYYEGTSDEAEQFVKDNFAGTGTYECKGSGGTDFPKQVYGLHLMSSWDRESFHNTKLMLRGLSSLPIPPDLDKPAPHKITCRLVNECGLGAEGHAGLLESLTSPLILADNQGRGLATYVTLGAITGAFYKSSEIAKHLHSAFPYKDRLYTIQYQTWWNESPELKELEQNNPVYVNLNRALDWMQKSRDACIANTGGAFISFKDSSIPTETYFGDSYAELKRIKKDYSDDEYNHFRSRKTII